MEKVLSKMGIMVLVVMIAGIAMSTMAIGEEKGPGLQNQVTASVINVNTATVKELAGLSGIGKKKAEAIVTYRTDNGNFNAVNDLKKVKGIGKTIIAKIRDRIVVN